MRIIDQSALLQLPDPCLLLVLSYCADDPRSLFSAARAHSRLHQAAVSVLSSIKAVLPQQQGADSILLYLQNHGKHINSIDLEGCLMENVTFTFRKLPYKELLGLTRIRFSRLHMWLRPYAWPWDDVPGLQEAGVPPLKQLQLDACVLVDQHEGLAALLAALPDLQYLEYKWTNGKGCYGGMFDFDSCALQPLQHLTYLELAHDARMQTEQLHDLQGLTHLQDLRISHLWDYCIKPSMLSGMQNLTRLQAYGDCIDLSWFEPGALASKTNMQHLELDWFRISPHSSEGLVELLSHMQLMQQLTHLSLQGTLRADQQPLSAQMTEALSALTASSKLQYLDISNCALPTAVWSQIFPAGRQLKHLYWLNASLINPTDPPYVPDASRLVSCCPGLQTLKMECLQVRAELLAPLTGLSQLTKLKFRPLREPDGVEVVCQLTGLRELAFWDCSKTAEDALYLKLSQLQKLTRLRFEGHVDGTPLNVQLSCEAPGDEPVWRQVVRPVLNHSDPAVAQQVTAALAE